MLTPQQLLALAEKVATDPNLGANLAAFKTLADHPSFPGLIAFVRQVETDPLLATALSDLTPQRLTILQNILALFGGPTPTPAPAAP